MAPRRCKGCNEVARYDGSCKTEGCSCFRAPQYGCHWKHKKLAQTLGEEVAPRLGAFIVGGFASTLLHRHDIRVGIASGMFLKPVVPETALRVELLMCLYLCYWKWSTAAVLRNLTPRMDSLWRVTAKERARILENAWRAMEREMSSHQVVGHRDLHKVELLTRAEAKKITSVAESRFGYHPYMNPASRRTGGQQFRRLLPDLKSGKVARACAELVRTWAAASGASYRVSEKVLVDQQISLFSGRGARYNRTRFLRWLFQAEGMDVDIDEPDWQILAGMGSGAEGGLEAAGIDGFDGAVRACAELQGLGAAAPGAEYKLDDLICFLCMSQHAEAVSHPGLPAPARPVSIEEDLGVVDPPPPRGPQGPPAPPLVFDNPSEAQAASFAPEDGAAHPPLIKKARRWRANTMKQPLAQPTSRLWRAHTLLQPLAQPTSRPLVVSIALPLACCAQGDMLPWLPIVSAISLVQCCRSLHGDGLCIAGRIHDGRRHVADSVADTLFHPQQVAALKKKAGVSMSTMLRTLACATGWLEQCPPVFVDERLLPLALLRMAIKFEGLGQQVETALKFFQPLAGEKPALLSLECRLVEALWAARG